MRFSPDEETANIFGYTLALATQKYGVRVSAFCLMATHPHLVVIDKGADFSRFKQFLNSNLALAMNEKQDMTGQFWDQARVEGERVLLDPVRALSALSYVILNPVKRLVDDWREWRDLGLLGGPAEWNRPLTFTRPCVRFKRTPDEVQLVLEPIPSIDRTAEEVIGWIDRQQVLEKQLRAPIGVSAAQARHHFDQSKDEIVRWANSPEGDAYRLDEITRRSRLAGECRLFQSTDPQLLREAQEELTDFEDDYSISIAEFVKGNRTVPFPTGTDKMRWFNVEIAATNRRPTATALVTGAFDKRLRGPPIK